MLYYLPMCPWENFCQAKLRFCEVVLCSWIRQPSNTYSSLTYVGVGILLFRLSRSTPSFSGSLSGKLFSVTSIVLGLGSFIFHFAFGSPCCVLEMVLWIQRRNLTIYRMYWVSWGVMTGGFAFWLLDQSALLCNSANYWVNGHATWHVFTALSLIPLEIFYRKFPILQMSVENISLAKK